MSGEHRMWRELMQRANPGWSFSVGRHAQLGQGALSLDTFVYLVDVATAWSVAGGLAESEFRRLLRALEAAPAMAASARDGANGIREAADANLARDTEEAEGLIVTALAALTQTQTFVRAREAQQGRLTGHWLYLVYRLRDGSVLGRPGFATQGMPGLLSPERLHGLVVQTVAVDTGASGPTSVGRMIAAGGGAPVAEIYRA
ncbi:hypothetical protein GHT07_20665 [Caenimonas koreensis DSM 17982]|uniref:Uncharacterized protein n=1 Tax=Caenimonas koreensis DSM 17982 TaxID=1121255 RepID=A0A844AYQ7_9BURK|nr:hypothetical protein [Caenimonas koreensis]MRD49690.1 hypothetical protein [Caenimonas koreensis DSM 17982]